MNEISQLRGTVVAHLHGGCSTVSATLHSELIAVFNARPTKLFYRNFSSHSIYKNAKYIFSSKKSSECFLEPPCEWNICVKL